MRIKLLCLFGALSVMCGLAHANNAVIYGLNEHVQLTSPALRLAAKLDTGAKTASLSARDIVRFKRDGQSWVRFYLAIDEAHASPIERPLARVSKIKRRAGDYNPEEDAKTYTARPVIELEICMGNTLRTIEVNLTDRSAFEFPLLIGSDALSHFNALIDPKLQYATGEPSCAINTANAAE